MRFSLNLSVDRQQKKILKAAEEMANAIDYVVAAQKRNAKYGEAGKGLLPTMPNSWNKKLEKAGNNWRKLNEK